MAKPELSQSELSAAVADNRPFVAQYRTLYEIVWSHGTQEYIQRYVRRFHDGLPITKRGRFHFVSQDYAHKLIHGQIRTAG